MTIPKSSNSFQKAQNYVKSLAVYSYSLAVYALIPASRRRVVSWCESKHQETLSSSYYDSFFRSVKSNKNNNKREKIYAGKQGKKCRNQGGRERAWDND